MNKKLRNIILIATITSIGTISFQTNNSFAKYFDVTNMETLQEQNNRVYTNINPARDLANDCKKYIAACIDERCVEKRKVREKQQFAGVYDKCGRMSLVELKTEISDCLKRFSGPKYDIPQLCQSSIVSEINNFLTNKDKLETSYKKSSGDCVEAKKELYAARNCHAVMVKSSGDFSVELQQEIYNTCGPVAQGGNANIAADFFTAGMILNDNTGIIKDNDAQPVRSQNWRQLSEAKLAQYVENAQSTCGEEDYEIAAINIYTPEDKTLEQEQLEAQAIEDGRDWANNTDYQECRNRNITQPLENAIWKYNNQKSCYQECVSGFEAINGICYPK